MSGESAPAAPQTTSATSASSNLPPIRIGTRRSKLALIQAEIVQKELQKAWPNREFTVHPMATMGDKNQVTPLHNFGAKALWTHELEALLVIGGTEEGKAKARSEIQPAAEAEGKIREEEKKGDVMGEGEDDKVEGLDLIVHSLKDMPTQLPPNLTIGAIFPREDPRDALVIKPSLLETLPKDSPHTLSSLPEGSCIGTSSVRRSAQTKRIHPTFTFRDIRGNVGTRLAKLDAEDSEYSATILAAAGLIRLGLQDRISAYLESDSDGIVTEETGPKGMLHAVGQGALGIEIREDDQDLIEILSKVGCEKTTKSTLAERSLMRTLEGGCSVPIGVETKWLPKTTASTSTTGVPAKEEEAAEGREMGPATQKQRLHTHDGEGETLRMRAMVVSIDGSKSAYAELTGQAKSREESDEFGRHVAALLVERGADKILDEINLDRNIVEKQGNA